MNEEYTYIAENLKSLIQKHNIPRLLLCSEFGISLAMLDDFEEKRVKMPLDMIEKLYGIFYEGKPILV